jgi:hypothetical protein
MQQQPYQQQQQSFQQPYQQQQYQQPYQQQQQQYQQQSGGMGGGGDAQWAPAAVALLAAIAGDKELKVQMAAPLSEVGGGGATGGGCGPAWAFGCLVYSMQMQQGVVATPQLQTGVVVYPIHSLSDSIIYAAG